MEKLIRTCNFCEIEFETYHPTADYCSRSHKERARERRRRVSEKMRSHAYTVVYPARCDFCGECYVGRRQSKRFCSKLCASQRKREIKIKQTQELDTKLQGFRQKIYFRDAGLCQLCGEAVLLTAKYPDPFSFSVDHIVPSSLGGAHNMNNLQLAHLGCNIKKSNKL